MTDLFIPEVVLLNMVRREQIPIAPALFIDFDNRVCCRWARREDPTGPQHCGMIRAGACRLGDGRPCAFDEPESAEIWERIREQQRYDK